MHPSERRRNAAKARVDRPWWLIVVSVLLGVLVVDLTEVRDDGPPVVWPLGIPVDDSDSWKLVPAGPHDIFDLAVRVLAAEAEDAVLERARETEVLEAKLREKRL